MPELFPAAYSKKQAAAMASKLTDAAAALYQSPENERAVLPHMLPATIIKQLPNGTVEQVADTLTHLADTLMARPVFQMQLAYEPSSQLLKSLLVWLNDHGPNPCLVEIVVNPTLIGGAVIEWNGQQADYSLKKALERHD
jgi:hypothetical protein